MRRSLLVCLGVLVAGAAVVLAVFATEPTATRAGATKETAMLVDVVEVRRGTHRPVFEVVGSVEASRDVIASPRVEGRVVEVGPDFTPGGLVEAGETLVRIDAADYEIALRRSRAALRQAEADLELERGRQDVARRDYESLDPELSDGNRALVLREPQMATATARVEAARAAVRRAELDLERTRVVAPFDAQVLRRDVVLGSQVSPGDEIGRLTGTGTYWVVATVPVAKLRWLSFAARDSVGSTVRVRDRAAWPAETFREGRLERLVGALEERTRLARVIVAVNDPLARSGGAPRLLLGSFVEVRIEGDAIEDVVRLDRAHLRADDTVWVMQEGELRIADAEVVVRDARHVYVREGLHDGDRVVTTDLTTVADGSPLRTSASDTTRTGR